MRIRRIERCRILAVLTALAVLVSGLPAVEAASAIGFKAYIDYGPQGYVVYGEAEAFPADTCRIQTLYSLDGENYQVYHREWEMPGPIESSVTSGCAIKTTQICLQSNDEPLRSYLAGELNRFHVKLRITAENGTICESGTALIERNSEPQPIPEGLTPIARFSSSMRVRGPSGFYGRYQLTVRDTAAAAEITAQLPDTLPVEVQVGNGICIVDCPVTWKPLEFTRLTAGESVTIADAAEEIAVPAGTLLDTPLGVYRLEEALPILEDRWNTDEVRLVLNAISEGESPSGGLAVDRGALKMFFSKKPTGATSIRAYTLVEGENAWTEIQGLSLLDSVNAQPSTANSGYAAVLGDQEEPYHSYLAAEAAGNDPVPFFVGLKIEGGVYDGQQLVLAWPDHYELPPNLPGVGSGSGGNEGNAGSDNKDDSTDEGQRPNLPQQPGESGDQPSGGDGENRPGESVDQPSGEESRLGGSKSHQPPGGGGNSQPSEGGTVPGGTGTEQPGGGGDQTSGDANALGGTGTKPPGAGNASGGTGSQRRPGGGGSTSGDSGGQQPGGGESATSSEVCAAENETGQRPNLPYQPEHEDAAADDASCQQISKSFRNPAAAGIASGNGIMRMEKSFGGSAAPIVVAGAACIAAVCAIVSARAAIARLCSRIAGKIRSILNLN